MVIPIHASFLPRANDSRKKPAEHWQKVSGKSSAICSEANVLWSFQQNMCRLTSPGNTWRKAGLRLVFRSTADVPAASVYFCGVNILTSETVADLRFDRQKTCPVWRLGRQIIRKQR